MSKIKKYSDFNNKSEKEELLIESCGRNISSCGGKGSSGYTEDDRNNDIRRKRNELIDDLTHSCAECSTTLAKDAKFCQECGHKVPDEIRNQEN